MEFHPGKEFKYFRILSLNLLRIIWNFAMYLRVNSKMLEYLPYKDFNLYTF